MTDIWKQAILAENEELKAENERLTITLQAIKQECSDDKTIGYHDWIVWQINQALKEPTNGIK